MIAFVLGTRPELIKTAPVMHELGRRGLEFAIIHTGQHYSGTLDEIFFRELGLPAPRTHLGVGSMPPVQQVAQMLAGVADALVELRPKVVVVQGDTNSVLAGALAAHMIGVPVAHLEAGLRSDDWTMPEEGNRVLAGRVAAVHFCPTELQRARLAAEGITRGVYVVGNTAVDAYMQFGSMADKLSNAPVRLGLDGRAFGLLTLHRPSNVDEAGRLEKLLAGLSATARALGLVLVFPIHPRTRQNLRAFGLEHQLEAPTFRVTEPLGYMDMLALMRRSTIALTDSGGVQEEACTLRVPCVTLRPNTERPETIHTGANMLCDATDAATLTAAVQEMLQRPRTWDNPLGDGTAAIRVVDVLTSPKTRWLPSGQP